jgi:kynurenine 3-monooxygenase
VGTRRGDEGSRGVQSRMTTHDAQAGETGVGFAGKTATIVGAGLAGCLLACYLAKLGYRVQLFERRGDPRAVGYLGGRSINLALSARGLWGLAGIGLDKEVLARAIPMKGRMIHPPTMPAQGGQPGFQAYSKNPGDAINSISRGGLNMALLSAAARCEGMTFRFQHRCVDIDPDACTASFMDDVSGETVEVKSDLILGADGAFSPVRGRLQKTDRFEYSQTYLAHGYKELHIPPLPEGSPQGPWGRYAMDPNALHIWPRGGSMMIALPNPDASFTCTLFWPYEGEHSFGQLRTNEEVRAFFARHYPDAPAMMPTLVEDFQHNPVSSLVTVRCWPWAYKSRSGGGVVLLGDAAHAIVPFFGQGMNAAFEDVRVLAECLQRHGAGSVHAAMEEYQRLRKVNADAIARMALDNFVEMRDKVGSRLFVWRKKIEHVLHAIAPDALTPKYNLVSFSTVPYIEALRRGARMDRLLRVCVLLAALLVLAGVWLLCAWVGLPVWLLLIAVMLGAWWMWDRACHERDTAV